MLTKSTSAAGSSFSVADDFGPVDGAEAESGVLLGLFEDRDA
jgi:hypothetical protein